MTLLARFLWLGVGVVFCLAFGSLQYSRYPLPRGVPCLSGTIRCRLPRPVAFMKMGASGMYFRLSGQPVMAASAWRDFSTPHRILPAAVEAAECSVTVQPLSRSPERSLGMMAFSWVAAARLLPSISFTSASFSRPGFEPYFQGLAAPFSRCSHGRRSGGFRSCRTRLELWERRGLVPSGGVCLISCSRRIYVRPGGRRRLGGWFGRGVPAGTPCL